MDEFFDCNTKKLSRKTVQLNACCWLVRSRPIILICLSPEKYRLRSQETVSAKNEVM